MDLKAIWKMSGTVFQQMLMTGDFNSARNMAEALRPSNK
jgi:hypothetical protein